MEELSMENMKYKVGRGFKISIRRKGTRVVIRKNLNPRVLRGLERRRKASFLLLPKAYDEYMKNREKRIQNVR